MQSPKARVRSVGSAAGGSGEDPIDKVLLFRILDGPAKIHIWKIGAEAIAVGIVVLRPEQYRRVGETRVLGKDAVDLPSAQHQPQSVAPPAQERQVPQSRDFEAVLHVKVRRSVVQSLVAGRELLGADLERREVQALAPGIDGVKLDSLSESARATNDHGVVIGVHIWQRKKYPVEARVAGGTHRRASCVASPARHSISTEVLYAVAIIVAEGIARYQPVQVDGADQLSAHAALIPQGKLVVPGDLLLIFKGVLVNVGVGFMRGGAKYVHRSGARTQGVATESAIGGHPKGEARIHRIAEWRIAGPQGVEDGSSRRQGGAGIEETTYARTTKKRRVLPDIGEDIPEVPVVLNAESTPEYGVSRLRPRTPCEANARRQVIAVGRVQLFHHLHAAIHQTLRAEDVVADAVLLL